MADERDLSAGDSEAWAADERDAQRAEVETPGACLRAERERQELRLQRVADEMHLSLQTMQAIEADRFAELGAEVFARGHLRRYAALLNLSVEDILARYDRLYGQARAQEPQLIQPRAIEARRAELPREESVFNVAPRRSGGRHATYTLGWAAAGLGMVIMIVWLSHSSWMDAKKNDPVTAETVAEPQVGADVQSADVQSGVISAAPSQQAAVVKPKPAPIAAVKSPSAPATPVATPPKPAATNAAPNAAAAGKLHVSLTFTAESWVEAYDAQGARMAYGVGLPDSPRAFDVTPPAQIVLGNAEAVTVEVNGRPMPLPARRSASGRLRLTLNAKGELN